jgi:hypothetical protein
MRREYEQKKNRIEKSASQRYVRCKKKKQKDNLSSWRPRGLIVLILAV